MKFSCNVFTSHFQWSNTFSVLLQLFLFSKALLSSQLLYVFFSKCYDPLASTLGSCSYSTASKAFLFSLYNKDGYNPVKLTQYQRKTKAIYSCSTYGPTFGYGGGHLHDIYISDNLTINQPTNSYTRCGSTYSVPSGYSAGDCGFFTGALYFTPSDIEVFYEIGN